MVSFFKTSHKWEKWDHQFVICDLKVAFATFVLVCLVCLKRALLKQEKMFFISLRKLFSFLR